VPSSDLSNTSREPMIKKQGHTSTGTQGSDENAKVKGRPAVRDLEIGK